MGITLTTASSILKEDYQPAIADQLNNKTILMQRLQRNTEDFEGKRAYLPLHVSRNEGIGARQEKGVLPTAGQQGYNAATWNMSYQYGRIEVSGPAMFSMKSDAGSFVRAVDSEVKGMVRDLSNDMNRQAFSNGSGALTLGTAIEPIGETTIAVASTKYLRVGMKIDMITDRTVSATGQSLSNVEITAVNPSTNTFTVGAPGVSVATTAANSVVARHGSYLNEMYGLDAVINDGNPYSSVGVANTYGNIDRTVAANSWWQANRLAQAGAAISLDIMEQGIDAGELAGDGETTLILTDYVQYRKYAALLIPDKRFPTANGQEIDLDGGFKALTYDGVPVVKDKDAPAQNMWFLDEPSLMLFVLADFQWMDKDGSILSRVLNQDNYEATLFAYIQLGCEHCNRQTVISGLAA